MNEFDQQRLDRELDRLFHAYHEACPAPEPSARFMPEIWGRLEARRRSTSVFRRLTQSLVAGAGLAVVLMTMVLIPRFQKQQVYGASYVEVLAANEMLEQMAFSPEHVAPPAEDPVVLPEEMK